MRAVVQLASPLRHQDAIAGADGGPDDHVRPAALACKLSELLLPSDQFGLNFEHCAHSLVPDLRRRRCSATDAAACQSTK